jgi:hypothetical protein
MGSSNCFGGLKCLQLISRAIQLLCSLVILGIFAYYLSSLSSHHMDIRSGIPAVEGIAVISVLYSAAGLFAACCTAGSRALSIGFISLDVALAITYIYMAVENRSASGGCNTEIVYTVYGSGDPWAKPGNFSELPTYRYACQLQMVCLVLSCVAM